jgi:hypothetical protein
MGLLNPTLTAAAFPLARPGAPGLVYPCVLLHVSSAHLSPRGLTCPPRCLLGVFANKPCSGAHWPSLFRGMPTVEDLPFLHVSARVLACFCLR